MSTEFPRTRDWSVTELGRRGDGAVPCLKIAGLVEVEGGCAAPYLDQVCTADCGAATLVLTLRDAAPPRGGRAPELRPLAFKKVESYATYDRVLILWKGATLRSLEVARPG
ncbi:hypothetical protein M446_5745 [Methylobacterium sp. 4-46]|uniref:hypothetical protein n=1 Tax=unclassified Methylobacterium TaxID=2615210 RepID=UPI000165CCBB|nr:MULTISPECIES: hypothetical protein [Methylobacterium]ACA20033.1 hypothetical protein M446_5745 [Methylobacterium sp. 4-46]WFT79220.1 hypothetical protein QA634_29000 [Methylobacterium nodulans]